MGDEVVERREKLAAAEMRCAVLTEQVRVLQRERDTFAQQLRQLMTIVDRLDRRFSEVLEEMAELKADRAAELRKEVAELTGQVPPPPSLNEAPKPPPGGTSRTGKGKKGRDAHGRNTKPGSGLAVCTTDEGVESARRAGARTCGSWRSSSTSSGTTSAGTSASGSAGAGTSGATAASV